MLRRSHQRDWSLWLAFIAVLLAAYGTACRREPQAAAQPAANQTTANQLTSVRTVAIPIDGMICQVCAGTVKSALKKVDGVNDAQINLEKRTAVVHYDERNVSLDALARAIKDAGFKPGAPTAP
jgi:mercuric ion binding protein